MSLLFVTPQEMSSTTILGGNVDVDKYLFSIEMVQESVIEPLLGTELYQKIIDDLTNETITGDYLTLYTDYIKPITKNEATAEYLEIASLMVANGGVFKHVPDKAEIPSESETDKLAGKYHQLAQMYIGRFEKWICKNPLMEYKKYQDEVNARNVQTTSGWYFGESNGCDCDNLDCGKCQY